MDEGKATNFAFVFFLYLYNSFLHITASNLILPLLLLIHLLVFQSV